MTTLLILYAIQIHMDPEILVEVEITIWIDNTEVLSRAGKRGTCNRIRDSLVLDFDL